MAATTYRKLAEIIRTEHFGGGMPSDDALLSIKFIAERIATKVAKYATISAFTNSNSQETTFANDQFISVFNGIALLTDPDTSNRYVKMPQTPAGLPNNQEIAKISFSGAPNLDVWPMRNKDQFAQNGLGSIPNVVFGMVENGNIVFPDLPTIINGTVNLKLVGAISGATLLDSVLNVSKDIEDSILTDILKELVIEYSVKPDVLNNAVS